MEIRRVNPTDNFSAIGEIYVQSWRAAYRGIVPQDYLDGLQGARWAGFLAEGHPASFVILENEGYIGTSAVCAARDEKMTGFGEVISIYLLPEYFGKGYAEPLLCCAVNALVKEGFADIYLWVLEENARARRFYEKHGFAHNGDAASITISGKELTELRYVKRC